MVDAAKTTIREIAERDVRAAADIEASAWSSEKGRDPNEGWTDQRTREIRGLISDEHSWGLVSEEGSRLLGMCLVEPEREFGFGDLVSGVAKVTSISVTPGRWGEGHGRALLSSALDRMRGQRLVRARIWAALSNHRAIRLYESMGFQRTGRLEMDEGEKIVEYQLDLK